MRRVLTFAAVLALACPAVSSAQVAAPAIDLPAPVAGPVVAPGNAPTVAATDAPRSVVVAGQQALAEVRSDAASARGVPGMARGKSFGEAEALMIVGGAAFVAGMLIDGRVGTFVSVVGLGVGLYGLYLYLR